MKTVKSFVFSSSPSSLFSGYTEPVSVPELAHLTPCQCDITQTTNFTPVYCSVKYSFPFHFNQTKFFKETGKVSINIVYRCDCDFSIFPDRCVWFDSYRLERSRVWSMQHCVCPRPGGGGRNCVLSTPHSLIRRAGRRQWQPPRD